MKFLKNISLFNTEGLSESEIRVIKIFNLIPFYSSIATLIYSIHYLFGFKTIPGFLLTASFGLIYLLYYMHFKYWGFYAGVRLLSINFIIHISSIVIFFTSKESGFHLYLLLVVPMAHFFIEDKNKRFQLFISCASLILFILCEMAGDRFAQLDFPSSIYTFHFYSTMTVVFGIFLLISRMHNNEIKRREKELNEAVKEIKQLSGLLPICAHCKKIKDDKGYWNKIESYIEKHSEAEFSHGLCPQCMEELYPVHYHKMEKTKK